jgi:hypothetical protein
MKGQKFSDALATTDSQRAWDEGHQYFVLQTRNTLVGQNNGSVPGVAEAIEAVEGVGWWYQTSSYVFDQRGMKSLVGIHTFLRPPDLE